MLAFLAGAAAGAAVALLTAPEPGRDVRGRLRDWARDAQDRVEKLPGAVREAAGRASTAARSAFEETYTRDPKDHETADV